MLSNTPAYILKHISIWKLSYTASVQCNSGKSSKFGNAVLQLAHQKWTDNSSHRQLRKEYNQGVWNWNFVFYKNYARDFPVSLLIVPKFVFFERPFSIYSWFINGQYSSNSLLCSQGFFYANIKDLWTEAAQDRVVLSIVSNLP